MLRTYRRGSRSSPEEQNSRISATIRSGDLHTVGRWLRGQPFGCVVRIAGPVNPDSTGSRGGPVSPDRLRFTTVVGSRRSRCGAEGPSRRLMPLIRQKAAQPQPDGRQGLGNTARRPGVDRRPASTLVLTGTCGPTIGAAPTRAPTRTSRRSSNSINVGQGAASFGGGLIVPRLYLAQMGTCGSPMGRPTSKARRASKSSSSALKVKSS